MLVDLVICIEQSCSLNIFSGILHLEVNLPEENAGSV